MAFIRFDEQTEPATPPAGKAALYVDSVDSKVAVKKDDGSVEKIPPSLISEKSNITDQVITSGGTLVLAHGLANTPIIIIPQLVNIVAEHGYNIDDVVNVGHGRGTTPASSSRGVSIWADATNINLVIGSDVNAFVIMSRTGGSEGNQAELTNANWKLRITAYA